MNFGKVIAGLSLIAMIAMCGCGMGKEVTEKEVTELNEQQKEILEQEGLQTDIEELSASQKRCIMKTDRRCRMELCNRSHCTNQRKTVCAGIERISWEFIVGWNKL